MKLVVSSDAALESASRRFLRAGFVIVLTLLSASAAGLMLLGERSHALDSISDIAAFQQREPRSIWLGEIPDMAPYKLARTTLAQPDILFVGHSRCGQFRAGMLAPYVAYNACTSAWTFDQIADFVDRVTTAARPKVIVFTLDYFMFADAWVENYASSRAGDFRQGYKAFFRRVRELLAYALRAGPADLLSDRFDQFEQQRLLGPYALRRQQGYRADGSTLYGPEMRAKIGVRNAKSAANFLSDFPSSADLSASQKLALGRLAQVAKSRGAALIGVQLPFAKEASDFLDNDEGFRPYAGGWREFNRDETRKLFSDLGITFIDASRIPIAARHDHFIDPSHPNEAGTLATLIELTRDDRIKAMLPRLDAAALQSKYDEALRAGDLIEIYR